MKKANLKANLSVFQSHLNPLFVGLSLISTVLVVGCVPPKKGGQAPIQTKVVSVSEQTSACETQIKNQIEAKALFLKEVEGLEADIQKLNSRFSSLKDFEYNVQQIRKEIQVVGIDISNTTGDSAFKVGYQISKADESTEALLGLSISAEQVTKESNTEITQNFLVSQDCEMTLSETSKVELVKSSEHSLQVSTTEAFVDGGKNSKTENFELTDSEGLLNFNTNINESNDIPESGAIFMSGIGLGRYKKLDLDKSFVKEFGLDLVLTNFKMDISIDSNSSFTMIMGEDKVHGISLSIVSNQKTWTLPRAIWAEQVLGSSQNLDMFIEHRLPNDYLNTHDSLVLETQKAPAYDHFDAYWTVKNVSGSDYTLVANPNPVIVGAVSNLDLESNSTIQTDLPQIQSIAKEIAAQSSDRVGQIQLILNYLNKNYKYDYEMLKNNVVRSLTTEEALARGTGVCQHYSVIYTAIARALKIPTRIVMGYHLAGSAAVSHAWVESVIEDGKASDDNKWRVIEPQSATTLQNMNVRFYLPTVRARLLEDRTSGYAESISDLLDIEYILKPVSGS